MAEARKILILAGDGIGPEVMREARRLLDWLDRRRGIRFELEEDLVGGASIDARGTPLSEATLALAKAADAVLFGAVGGPAWEKLGFDKRPEMAILGLRRELGLFANLRPAVVYDPLVAASTLKPDIVRGLDLMIVRESTGGIYFGEPRGVNTEVYTTSEIERVGRVAFTLAQTRNKRVASVEKSNVMESGVLWRETITALGRAEFPDIELTHVLADNCAMQLVRTPKQFDVIVTTNLFGDLLSDLAGQLTGSLGMLPSATLGAVQADGRRHALYEPIHGSAPDIAGRGVANPLAQILSLAMLLRQSFGLAAEAALIETAVVRVLSNGLRTADIMAPGAARVGTGVMGEAVLRELDKVPQ
jgi:3-isopropylmalate dehydrogenase